MKNLWKCWVESKERSSSISALCKWKGNIRKRWKVWWDPSNLMFKMNVRFEFVYMFWIQSLLSVLREWRLLENYVVFVQPNAKQELVHSKTKSHWNTRAIWEPYRCISEDYWDPDALAQESTEFLRYFNLQLLCCGEGFSKFRHCFIDEILLFVAEGRLFNEANFEIFRRTPGGWTPICHICFNYKCLIHELHNSKWKKYHL